MDITLNFGGEEFSYKCIDTKDKVKDIFLKFKNKIDLSSLIFLYSGIPIDGNLSIGKIINRVDTERNKMTILIQDNKEESNSCIITSKEILCPNCKESAKFDIKNYKIFLQCIKGHKVGDILLNQFEKTQKIDLSKIICDKCKQNNKAESYKHIFYKCNQCNTSLCIKCQNIHQNENKEHNFISYDEKNYICGIHNEKYVSFCKNCQKNLCFICKKKHKEHSLINYEDFLPDMIEEKSNINKLREDINKVNGIIDNFIQSLNNIKDNFENLYEIKKNIFDSLNSKCINYEMLYSYNQIVESQILKDINFIANNKNKNEILKKMKEINDKISNGNENENSEIKQNIPFDKVKINIPLDIPSEIKPLNMDEKLNESDELQLDDIINAFTDPFNEKEFYCKIINKLLRNEKELKYQLPIVPESDEIFKKIKDGIILAKLINKAEPGTLDERVLAKNLDMNLESKITNISLVINSAKSIGCLTEITEDDILDEERKLIIDLIYQILKLIIFKKISLKEFPQMLRFKQDKEENEELLALSPEDFIKRWFNYHLSKNNHPNKFENFGEDLRTSEKYIILLNILIKECNKTSLRQKNLLEKAKTFLEKIKKGERMNITNDSEQFNKFFLAELFLVNHGMREPTIEEKKISSELLDDDEEGIREERSFRAWINSVRLEGVNKINNLYQESRTGILLLKILDKIKPGVVNWKIVEFKNFKNPFKVGVNCQEAIDASKRSGLKIVRIGNKDIQEGRKKHILEIVWQIIRACTLKKIGEKSEEELIEWANSSIPIEMKIIDLKDKKLKDGLFWFYLLDAIAPGCVNWELVIKKNQSDKDREMNAKYILSIARGLGAMNFVVWEDIIEVKSKLLLMFLASLYELAE